MSCGKDSEFLIFPKDGVALVTVSRNLNSFKSQNAFPEYSPNLADAPNFLLYGDKLDQKGFYIVCEEEHEKEFEDLCLNNDCDISDFWEFVDFRLDNGWNNWRDHLQSGTNYKDGLYFRQAATDGGLHQEKQSPLASDPDTRNEFLLTTAHANGPPAYLHLILDSLKDYNPPALTDFNSVTKTWTVDTIKDLNGAIVTNDPDWVCFSDNAYIFTKSSFVKYFPGNLDCPEDEELVRRGLSGIWLSFTINTPEFQSFENPGRILMDFQVSETAKEYIEDYTVEIMYSDFKRVVFRISKDTGEQADLILSPHS